MSLSDALRDLPDEAMVPVGWIREHMDEAPEEIPAVDEDPDEADFRLLEDICTRNLGPRRWDGDGA